VHHAQVRLQTSDIAVHVCDRHLAAHEQAACQVSGLAWVHLHELVLAREDLCEDLPNHAHIVLMITIIILIIIINNNDDNAHTVRHDQEPFTTTTSSSISSRRISCMSALC